MKKVISFSLWGNNFRYTGGALQNIELAKEFYQGWKCRFYVDRLIDPDLHSTLSSNDNVEIVLMSDPGDWTSMTWRFLCVSDPTVDIAIIRDLDSRLHQREVVLVNEWIESDMSFHIIRDHKNHTAKIMGGMWGCKKNTIPNIKELIEKYQLGNYWQTDQEFLRDIIYPVVEDVAMVHDYFRVVDDSPFPEMLNDRDPDHFIGQAYDGDGRVLDKDVYFSDYLKYCIK